MPEAGYTCLMSSARGASLVEILVVIGILTIMAALTYETYIKVNANKALDLDAQLIIAEIAQARSLSMGSKNGSQWGVHIASTSVTLFEGTAYDAGAALNMTSALHPAEHVSNITLYGGGTDIVFERLSGDTAATVTIAVCYVASSSIV